MSVINRFDLTRIEAADLRRLMRRSESDIESAVDAVKPILDAVRSDGDAALVKLTEELDGVRLPVERLRVEERELAAAGSNISADLRAAIDYSMDNIRRFHEAQMPGESWMVELRPGVLAGEKTTPITSVGLYIPRGKGCFPSVMMMLGIPAVVAGVRDVVVCTPPGEDGSVDQATLYVAERCGIKDVFRVGGAQALAAMAYGTSSVPSVHKVIGPSNRYGAAAKRLLFGQIDVGTPAGPSESIVLCDEFADPDIAANDLLIEAEHGPDSAALLVTHSRELADAVAERLPQLVAALPNPRRDYCEAVLSGFGGIVLTPGLSESIGFVNRYAPEHLEVLVDNPFEVLPRLRNAGEILLGPHTPISLGNFSLGVNAILPTGGFANSFSCVSVFDYLKRSSFGHVSREGFREMKPHVELLANYEGFPAHASALKARE